VAQQGVIDKILPKQKSTLILMGKITIWAVTLTIVNMVNVVLVFLRKLLHYGCYIMAARYCGDLAVRVDFLVNWLLHDREKLLTNYW
jgi:hypothetical protein